MRAAKFRRWLIVGIGVALLCALPGAVGALPVHAVNLSTAELESRILASTDHPYQGYAENDGRLDLPQLPQLSSVSSLLSGTTMIRTWYSNANQWRTDIVTDTGEQDMYQDARGTTAWDFETGQVTRLNGTPPAHLPRAQDFVPQQLALRLLHTAGKADSVTSLPAQRVAGIAADGLQIVPASADNTIGRIDIWADPDTGVPLEVSIYGRGESAPALTTRFLDVELTAPAASTVTFQAARGLAKSTTNTDDFDTLLAGTPFVSLPPTLAGGHAQPVQSGTDTVEYGSGLDSILVFGLPPTTGSSAMSAAAPAAAPVTFTDGTGELIKTPLLNLLLVRLGTDKHSLIFLLAGFVGSDRLVQAGTDLVNQFANVSVLCVPHEACMSFNPGPDSTGWTLPISAPGCTVQALSNDGFEFSCPPPTPGDDR